MVAPAETSEDFRALRASDVGARAQEAEERPRSSYGADPGAVAWRWLYREMRHAGASTVTELKSQVVESYASRLGYGYFRTGYGRRGVFMPFEGS